MDFAAELSKFPPDSKEYKFFEKIFSKLDPDCVRKSLRAKQQEVHRKLRKAQEKYFQNKILNSALIKASEKFKIQEASTGDSSSFVHSMYLNMAKRSLPSEESKEFKPFGLSKEKMSKTLEDLKSDVKYADFKKCVEDELKDFCKKLILSTGGVILPGEDWQITLDRTIKELKSKVTDVSSYKTREQARKKEMRKMIKTYYEKLSEGVSLLTKELSLKQDLLEFKLDFGEMYRLRCHAVSLKLKCCELKILLCTYNEETMPALKAISAHLSEMEQKLSEDLSEKNASLESYSKLGEDFERLVDEYTELSKSIKDEEWALDELQNQNPAATD